jgi:hypothetical protein
MSKYHNQHITERFGMTSCRGGRTVKGAADEKLEKENVDEMDCDWVIVDMVPYNIREILFERTAHVTSDSQQVPHYEVHVYGAAEHYEAHITTRTDPASNLQANCSLLERFEVELACVADAPGNSVRCAYLLNIARMLADDLESLQAEDSRVELKSRVRDLIQTIICICRRVEQMLIGGGAIDSAKLIDHLNATTKARKELIDLCQTVGISGIIANVCGSEAAKYVFRCSAAAACCLLVPHSVALTILVTILGLDTGVVKELMKELFRHT